MCLLIRNISSEWGIEYFQNIMMSRHHYCKCLMNEIRFQWCIISSYMHVLHSPWTKLGINDAIGFYRCTCYTLEDQNICDWNKWEDDVTHLPYRQRFISVSGSSHYLYIPSNFSTLHSSYNNPRGNSRNTNSTYFVALSGDHWFF